MRARFLAIIFVLGLSSGAPASDTAVPANIAVPTPPTQPVAFSHKRHAGNEGMVCTACHTGVAEMTPASDGGRHMTLPATEVCIACHIEVAAETPAIEKLRAFDDAGKPVPWVRVFSLLPGVNWSHKPHIDADVDCTECHGSVPTLEVMAETTAVTAMVSCLGCHEARGAATQCVTCHAWPTDALIKSVRD